MGSCPSRQKGPCPKLKTIGKSEDSENRLIGITTACVCAYIVIVIGRGTELVPVLSGLPIGDMFVAVVFLTLLAAPSGSFVAVRGSYLSGNILIFVLLCVISIAYSIWFRNSVNFFLGGFALTLILYFFVLKITRTKQQIENVFTALVLCSATLVIAAFLARSGSGRLRVQSSYDENDLAMIIVSLLPIVLAKYHLVKGNFAKWLLLLLSLGSLFVVILTQSRGGLVGLAAVMLYLALFPGFKPEYSAPWAQRVFVRVSVIVLVGVVMLMAAPESALERLGSLFNLSEDYNVVGAKDGRLSIWGRGFQYLNTAPWGAGISAFQVAESMMGGQFRAPHNSFVQAMVEIGYLGGIVYIAIYVRAASCLHKISKSHETSPIDGEDFRTVLYSRALLGSLLGYSAAGFFLSHAYSPLGFVLFALVAAVVRTRSGQSVEVDSRLRRGAEAR